MLVSHKRCAFLEKRILHTLFSINSDENLEFKAAPDQHRFPIVSVGEDKCLVVEVNSLPRSTLNLKDADPGADL